MEKTAWTSLCYGRESFLYWGVNACEGRRASWPTVTPALGRGVGSICSFISAHPSLFSPFSISPRMLVSGQLEQQISWKWDSWAPVDTHEAICSQLVLTFPWNWVDFITQKNSHRQCLSSFPLPSPVSYVTQQAAIRFGSSVPRNCTRYMPSWTQSSLLIAFSI